MFFTNCYFAWGRRLNIPVVGIATTALLPDWVNPYMGNPFDPSNDVGFFSSGVPPTTFLERLINFYKSTSLVAEANYYFRAQNSYINKYFGPGYSSAQEFNRDLSLVLLNYDSAVFGPRTFSPAVVPIGGIHMTAEEEPLQEDVQKWLDGSTSGFVYFSFGSMVKIESFPKPVLDVFYSTFRKIFPIRVLMKIASPEELPPGLPTNVMTKSWISQRRILGKFFFQKNHET